MWEAMIGKKMTFFGLNYIYTGKVQSVSDDFVTLSEASIVYETGAFNTNTWQNAEKLPKGVNVMKRTVESFMELK